jgi:hypothetical protein
MIYRVTLRQLVKLRVQSGGVVFHVNFGNNLINLHWVLLIPVAFPPRTQPSHVSVTVNSWAHNKYKYARSSLHTLIASLESGLLLRNT